MINQNNVQGKNALGKNALLDETTSRFTLENNQENWDHLSCDDLYQQNLIPDDEFLYEERKGSVQASNSQQKRYQPFSKKDFQDLARALNSAFPIGDTAMCSCPVPSHGKGNGDKRPSLSISLKNDRLMMNCFADCTYPQILAALKEKGILPHHFQNQTQKNTQKVQNEGKSSETVDFRSSQLVPDLVPACTQNSKSEDSRSSQLVPNLVPISEIPEMMSEILEMMGDVSVINPENKSEMALKIWNESCEIWGTPAEGYLKNRGVDTAALKERGMTCLRFHPHLYNATAKESSGALITQVINKANAPIGIQRTWITKEGYKAFDKDSKQLLGLVKGGYGFLKEMPPSSLLDASMPQALIVEGLEDGLILSQCCPHSSIYIGFGNNIQSLDLPSSVKNVWIVADQDLVGQKFARLLKRRLQAEGRGVVICTPPKDYKDVNEWWVQANNQQEIAALISSSTPKYPARLTKVTSAQEAFSRNFEEVQFRVNNLLPEIGVAILAGNPKAGKSWLAYGCALHIQQGTPLFNSDSFTSKQGGVLYCSLEDNVPRLKSRYYMLRGEGETDLNHLFFHNILQPLNDGGLDEIQRFLDAYPTVQTIIIDPFQKVRPRQNKGSLDAYQKDYEDMGLLKDFSERNEVLVLVVHHLVKNQRENMVSDLNGSMGLSGAADVVLALKKQKESDSLHTHLLKVTGKDIEDQDIFLNVDDNWRYSLPSICLEEEKNTKEAILYLLKQSPYPLKPADICQELGKTDYNDKVALRKALKVLLTKDLIQKLEKGFYRYNQKADQQTNQKTDLCLKGQEGTSKGTSKGTTQNAQKQTIPENWVQEGTSEGTSCEALKQPISEDFNPFCTFLPENTHTAPEKPSYRLITDFNQALEAITHLVDKNEVVGLDLETTGLYPSEGAKARLLQISSSEGPVLVIDLFQVGGLESLKEPLQKLKAVAHNAVFEMKFLKASGIPLLLNCTLLANHVLTGKMAKLSDLCTTHLGITLDKTLQVSDWGQAVLTEDQLAYAAADAHVTRLLFHKMVPILKANGLERLYKIIRKAQLAVVDMELAGMPMDIKGHQAVLKTLIQERDGYQTKLREHLPDMNLKSTKQVGEWLTPILGGKDSASFAKWPKTPSGKLSTSEKDFKKGLSLLPKSLQELMTECYLPYKEREKHISTFGESLIKTLSPHTGRIHASFKMAGTITGRFSCSNPNLQNIPRGKAFRGLFKAPEGRTFVIADYSQMELRVAAIVTGETKLLQAYKEGQDIHAMTAGMLLQKNPATVTKEERQIAKAVNFGLLYGQGPKGLKDTAATDYGVTFSESESKQYREAWFKEYPLFASWHKRVGQESADSLFVKTPLGRKRTFTRSKEGDTYTANKAYNMPIQGGAAEVMLAALGHLPDFLGDLDAKPICVIHDEVVVETSPADAPKVQKALEEAMIQGMLDIFPDASTNGLVDAHIAASWADK